MEKLNLTFVNGTKPALNGTNMNKIAKKIDECVDSFNGEKSMGSIVVDDISCKNLYYIQSLDKYTYNATGGTVSTSGNVANTTINVTDFSKITFSWKSINATPTIRILEYNSSGGFIQRQNIRPYEVNSPQTVELHNSTSYFIVSVEHNDIDMVVDLQIEKGSTASEFTPHKTLDNTTYDITNQFTINSDVATLNTNYTSKIYKSGNAVWLNLHLKLNTGITGTIENVAVGNLSSGIKPITPVFDRCLIGTSGYSGWNFDIPDGHVFINSAGKITIRNFTTTSSEKKYITINLVYFVG